MKSGTEDCSIRDKTRKITTELNRLFQQQIELTKWEAFVGFTPTELQEYEGVVERIRQLYVELGQLAPAQEQGKRR